MDKVVEWVKRCPNPMRDDSDIEVRPFFVAADFGDTFTPELQAQVEKRHAEGVASKGG